MNLTRFISLRSKVGMAFESLGAHTEIGLHPIAVSGVYVDLSLAVRIKLSAGWRRAMFSNGASWYKHLWTKTHILKQFYSSLEANGVYLI